MLGWGSACPSISHFSLLNPAYRHGSWSLLCFGKGSNPAEASSSGLTDGGDDSLAVVVTYAKGLARRANLTEGSAGAAKSYKAKVASLTSERAGLQAQIRELTEELVKHRSDLKHASVARGQAEDKEKKAQKDAKVAEDELRLAREEMQVVKDDLWAKIGFGWTLRGKRL